MSIVLVGSTSGSVTLQEPAVAGTTVLSLPAVTGTILTTTSPKVGNVLQVISAAKTDTFSTTSTSYVDVTGLSVSITPTSSNSQILVLMDVKLGSSSNVGNFVRLVRDSTQIYVGDASVSRTRATYSNADDPTSQSAYQGAGIFLDSPATTSATTYKVQMMSEISPNTGTVFLNSSGEDLSTADFARMASSITVMEIAA